MCHYAYADCHFWYSSRFFLVICSAHMGEGERGNQQSEAIGSRDPDRLQARMTPDELARDQRKRLEAAMIDAVTRRGYAGTTLGGLVATAGVSKSTFYQHFESKEHCFWTTYETIVEEGSEALLAAYERGNGQRGKLRAVFAAHAERMAATPEAPSLVLVESLCLGSAGAEHRESTGARFEQTLRECYDEEPERGEASELAIRAATGGYRQVVYRCLRARQPKMLIDRANELADWMLSYQRLGREHVVGEAFFGGLQEAQRGMGAGGATPDLPGWDEPPDSHRSRRALTQRQRILRAIARLAAERGYANLSVPTISGGAGVSNQTFYQEFDSKQGALIAAFEELSERALGLAMEAYTEQDEWPRAAAAALSALLSYVATEPYFARLAFFELSAIGPAGLDRADAMMDRVVAFLEPREPLEQTRKLPAVVLHALGGGIWAVIEAEVGHNREDGLPALAPELTDFALLPFGSALDDAARP